MNRILILLFFAVAILGIIAPLNAAESLVSSEDKVYTIESKKKAVNLKITWNSNGGKVGTKKTTITFVKKGSKLNKLAVTPKRSGYTFNGWYSKKTGGKKITKNTIPSKSLTYFAQWKKSNKANVDSKLTGHWSCKSGSSYKHLYFYADGRFRYFFVGGYGALMKTEGKYSVSNGKVYFIEMKYYSKPDGYGLIEFRKDSKFGEGNYIGTFKDQTSEYQVRNNHLDIWPPNIGGGYYSIKDGNGYYIFDKENDS